MESRNAQLVRLTQLYAALHDCSRAAVGSVSEAELFPKVCAAAVKAGQMRMCWIGKVDTASGDVTSVAEYGPGSGYVTGLNITATQGHLLSEGPTGSAIRSGRPVWCQDFQNDPSTAPWHERGAQFGWRSSAAVPLLRNGEPYGAMTVYSETVNAFDARAQELLVDVALTVSGAIDGFEIASQKEKAFAELERYAKRLHGLTLATVALVSSLGEARDPYTAGHERRVAVLAVAIANEMELEASRIEGIWVSATLHDVGKIVVPMELLASPAKLSAIQYELVKTHSSAGFEILRNVDFPWPVAEVAFQHHERMDGGGYPRGLRANDILLEAKIIAVADVVEAMSSHRPYRPSLGIAAALEEIERGSETKYDPRSVEACLRLFRELEFVIPQ
ncbi:MAG: HD domain-containing phosphohydrolase [Pseudomonadota bacterium]